MKLHLLLTVLIVCAVLFAGAFLLLHQMGQASLRPLPGAALPDTAVAGDSVLTGSPDATDTIARYPVSTGPVDPLPPLPETAETQALPAADFPSSKAEWTAVAKKYAATRRTRWSDHLVKGMVHKVHLPEAGERILFLTFNAYSHNYPALFEWLETNRIPSTLFLSGGWVRRHPQQAKRLGELPELFEIENHGNRNIPLSSAGDTAYRRKGTATLAEALTDIADGADAVKEATGQTPRYLRPYMNYIDDVLVSALHELHIHTIGATVFADGGGTYGSEKIKHLILSAPHGAILLISVDARYPNILDGLKAAADAIANENLPVRFEQLSRYEAYFDRYTD